MCQILIIFYNNIIYYYYFRIKNLNNFFKHELFLIHQKKWGKY